MLSSHFIIFFFHILVFENPNVILSKFQNQLIKRQKLLKKKFCLRKMCSCDTVYNLVNILVAGPVMIGVPHYIAVKDKISYWKTNLSGARWDNSWKVQVWRCSSMISIFFVFKSQTRTFEFRENRNCELKNCNCGYDAKRLPYLVSR